MTEDKYLEAVGISYAGTLPKIKKSEDQLQPFYEAFTNALEAIQLSSEPSINGYIIVRKKLKGNMFSNEDQKFELDAISIEDSGIGLNTPEFERMKNLNDVSKSFSNRGTGRIQFIHFFERTTYESIFQDESSKTGFLQRHLTLSKSPTFLNHNAIIREDGTPKEIISQHSSTILTFKSPLSERDAQFYIDLSIGELKEQVIGRYLSYFCEKRNTLPKIKFELYINNVLTPHYLEIKLEDIPKVDKEGPLFIHYSKLSQDGKSIERTSNKEIFNLKAFKIPAQKLQKNGFYLTSKGELSTAIKLEKLLPDDNIENNRYLFLLSSEYIDRKDGDIRGKLNIPSYKQFKDAFILGNLFTEEEILLDDIEEVSNNSISKFYEEINKRNEEKKNEIEELEKMFLLNPETVRALKIKLSDTDVDILEKVYKADARIIAQKDAEIKKRFDALDKLNPSANDFEEKF